MSHWIIQRASSVALLVLLPFTIFVDFRFYLLLAACIAVHVNHGFDSIFLDYVHNAQAKRHFQTWLSSHYLRHLYLLLRFL